MGRRIFVTGSDGFVGRHLLQALAKSLDAADQIIAACRTNTSLSIPSARPVVFDICDPLQTLAAIRQAQPTCVVHLAAISTIREAQSDRELTWRVNVGGTRNLAEAVLEAAPDARFIFVGTSESYGNSFNLSPEPISELTRLDPRNTYAVSKAAADLLIGQMKYEGLNAVRFRPFNHTGPGQSERFVVSAFAAQIARIEYGRQDPTIRVGNLDSIRDFLDVRDVVRAYIRAIELPELPSQSIFNLASGTPRSIRQILDSLCARSQTEVRVEIDPDRQRPNETPIAVGSAILAEQVLGWQPKITWEKTADDVLGFWRAAVR